MECIRTAFGGMKGLIILSFSVVALVGCFSTGDESAPGPTQPVEISFCQGGVITLLPLIAQSQGFFEKRGITSRMIMKQDGKLALQGLLLGECSFGICGEPPLVTGSFTRQDFVVLASINLSDNATKILARRDLGITTANDLKGKRIGVRKGTLSHFFMDLYLKEKGISQHEVTLVFMEPGLMPDALVQGEIAAYSASDELVIKGSALLGERGVLLSEPGLCLNSINLVAGKEYVNAHPQTVRKVLGALLQAEEYYLRHPGPTLDDVRKQKGISRAELEAALKGQTHSVRLQESLLLTLEDHARWMIDNKIVAGTALPNFLKIIDPAPLKDLKPSVVTIIR